MGHGGVLGFGAVCLVLAACRGKNVDLGANDLGSQDGGTGGSTADGGGSGGSGGDTGSGGSGGDTGGSDGSGGSTFGPDGGGSGGSTGGTGGGTGGTGGGTGGRAVGVKASDKLDLLFVVDNSISMADKQAVLKNTVPNLVNHIASSGVKDLHVGVITSSIGGHGSTLCQSSDTSGNLRDEEVNDHAHLIPSRPRFAGELSKYPGAAVPTADGYIAWKRGDDTTALQGGVQAMITAAGEFGCGFEAQLEAMYRFLVDPAPPVEITTAPCPGSSQPCAYPTGLDATLLGQRAAFLRPDSVVAIVQLTDENDGSVRDLQQFYYIARDDSMFMLQPGSAACATNPNDACCYNCAMTPPAGCTPDPTCQQRSEDPSWRESDALNLRMYDQKRRFGLDFLYPVERYVNALSRAALCVSRADLDVAAADGCPDSDGKDGPDIVPNPLFTGSVKRDASMVHLVDIVGVPWQDLAVNPSAADLTYRTPAQLRQSGTWDVIVGDPKPAGGAAPIPPTNHLMLESVFERQGTDGQGNALAPSSAASPLANAVNGHERLVPDADDLQYACIFRLPQERDCAAVSLMPDPRPGCDCIDPRSQTSDPLCQASDGSRGAIQYSGKAYPSLRQLQVAKGLGDQAVVASICARNLTSPSSQDFGYRPAVEALLAAIAPNLL